MSAKRYCYCQATKKNTTWPSTMIQPRLTAGKISSIKSIKSVNVYQKQTYLFSTIAPTQQNSELRAKEQKTATTIKIIYTTILHQLDARGNAASS
mmetsp:Transcript_30896/g.53698  ORF Transcript_30896/g.53698 Transcript_30896/m.53698 type:complete len:95 (-) Transcript_30896:379-663(-)